jgi:hypothetical protein
MITISLILFFFYSFYYLNKAEKYIDEDIWVKLGSIADFEFIFWPVVLMISLQIFNLHYAI